MMIHKKNKVKNKFGELYTFMKINDDELRTMLIHLNVTNQNKALFLSHNKITDNGFSILAKKLKYNDTIEHLILSDNAIQLGLLVEESIIDLLKCNRKIKFFVLNNNNIDSTGAIHLGNALKNNTKVKHVVLENNKIGDYGFIYLLNQIKDSHQLESLVCAGNRLSDLSISFLINYIQKYNHLKLINIDGNNFADKKNVDHLQRIANQKNIVVKVGNTIKMTCV